ncbi:MAG: RsmD family RNA methyltransferase [Gemmatimonadota bacterium]|nr:RsmD family RNA methyltransferase [Gemmatimonadota bacterium]
MRVVRGKWAGRDLVSPGQRVRPTSEAVRDAWLTLLADDLGGARVLDLFSGSGALGIEALSRGARSVDFVEDGPASLHSLKANIARFPIRKRARVFKRDAIPFVEGLEPEAYDLAFADPPYGSRKLDRVVRRWLEVPFARVLGVEHEKTHVLPGRGHTHRFGDVSVTIYRAAAPKG